jgi:hypothetical protein
LEERANAVHLAPHPHPEMSHGTIVKTMIGLPGLGKTDFAAIEAFRCLRGCGQEALRVEGIPVEEQAPIRYEASHRRLRSVIRDLIYMAGRLISHARRLGLTLGRWNPWCPVWRRIYERIVNAGDRRGRPVEDM